MRYLLDTNVCVDYLNGHYPNVIRRIQATDPGDLVLSTVVVAELRFGADKSQQVRRNHARVDILSAEFPPLDFDLTAASAFGPIRTSLERSGQVIGPYDMLIAAQAVSRSLVLVTNNVEEFRRITALDIENWRHGDRH